MNNPFEGKTAEEKEELRKEIDAHSRPVEKEEVFKKLPKSTMSFKLDRLNVERLMKQTGLSQTDLVEKSMQAYVQVKLASLKEIKGLFTREELIALIDRQNGMLLSPEYQASVEVYLIGLEDFEELESGISRHGADYERVKGKVKSLTSAQVYFLQEEIDNFWNTTQSDLERFIAQYAKNE